LILFGTSAEGLADHVPGQAGNPSREPAAAGQANYNQYQYRLMGHGNGYGDYNTYEESMQARYPYLHNTQHHYPSPQVSYPYYELPPMYFPQAPPPPRNAKAGEPDLCSIMWYLLHNGVNLSFSLILLAIFLVGSNYGTRIWWYYLTMFCSFFKNCSMSSEIWI
jgi:hypothetical protein